MKRGRTSTGRVARGFVALAAMLVPSGVSVAAPEALGAWEGWASFREGDRCWAVTRPIAISRGQRAMPALLVARFPRGGAEVRARLSRESGLDRVRLSIGPRSIGLVASGATAHALHAGADASIVAAMRGADTLVIEGRDGRGRRFRDVYRLAGAASAIDAAMLGCLP